ncbi:MAG TPA: hypothetical protein VFH51_12895 [Myxococcota bacterium]|nr:hypothetical protein [Myxococcota bacterium]
MTRRSALRLPVLLACLALVLPLAAFADSCADCLWAASPDCCPPFCCSCCVPGAALRGLAPVEAVLSEAGLAGEPVEDRALPVDPRDVFHVPKRFLA